MRLPLLTNDHHLLRGLTRVFLKETQLQLLAFLSLITHIQLPEVQPFIWSSIDFEDYKLFSDKSLLTIISLSHMGFVILGIWMI